jgi:hypothetical protein
MILIALAICLGVVALVIGIALLAVVIAVKGASHGTF